MKRYLFAIYLTFAFLPVVQAAAQDVANKTNTKKVTIQATGDVQFSNVQACGGLTCYTMLGTLNVQGNGVVLSAEGMFDPSKCTVSRSKGTCCQNTVSGSAGVFGDSISFSYSGLSCQKKPTLAKLTNGPLTITGGTGLFAGVTGSGKVTVTENPETGLGTLSLHGSGTQPPAD